MHARCHRLTPVRGVRVAKGKVPAAPSEPTSEPFTDLNVLDPQKKSQQQSRSRKKRGAGASGGDRKAAAVRIQSMQRGFIVRRKLVQFLKSAQQLQARTAATFPGQRRSNDTGGRRSPVMDTPVLVSSQPGAPMQTASAGDWNSEQRQRSERIREWVATSGASGSPPPPQEPEGRAGSKPRADHSPPKPKAGQSAQDERSAAHASLHRRRHHPPSMAARQPPPPPPDDDAMSVSSMGSQVRVQLIGHARNNM